MTVIITGASAGIGEALAEVLSQAGARLTLAARRVDRLNDLNQRLGGGHLAIECDVAKPDDCRRLIEQSHTHFGRIDTLVCNAGYGMGRTLAETTLEDYHAIFATNVWGSTECVRHAVPIMQRQAIAGGYRGQVMWVSSAIARRSLAYMGAYAATKAAQLSLAESLRLELEPDRIAVTSVHPVTTTTEFFGVAEKMTGRKMNVPGRTPLSQTSQQVARAMARRISNPTREVWPHEPSRWLLSLATLWPWAGDFGARQIKGKMDP
jgi:short-subunit dehydrogenase